MANKARSAPLFFIQNETQASSSSLRADLASAINASPFDIRYKENPSSVSVQETVNAYGDAPNRQQRKEAFLGAKVDEAIYNPHQLQRPISPFQVMAGTIISASLITGINSDLPGQTIAQVTENVYDTVTGDVLLIPQGSRLIGRYDNVIAFGQSRALVIWNRLIMPDGSSILIENLPGVDANGYAGLKDKVDFHTWRLVKAAVLSSLLGASAELGRNSNDSEIVNALRDSGQRTINQAGQKIVELNLDVQPTITIRPGWRLRIIVNQDLVLAPYGG